MADGRGRPLVVTRDEELLDELLRLADAGGVEVSVAVDALAAEDDWARAPLVVVGADQVDELIRRRVPRRLGVVLVAGTDRAGDTALWLRAEALHAEHVAVLPEGRAWLVSRFAQHGPVRELTNAPRAATVAVVAGGHSAAASEVALGLAVTGRRAGMAALLVCVAAWAPGSPPVTPAPLDALPLGAESPDSMLAGTAPVGGFEPAPPDGAVAPSGEGGASTGAGSLAVVALDRAADPGVASQALAAVLQAGRHVRDLVVIDLPGAGDDAALLALTCADRGYLVVAAEVRDCAVAKRVALRVRRHCPSVGLVVQARGPRGLRPAEVAHALDLPLVGVLPPQPPPARDPVAGRPHPGLYAGPLTRLCRRMLVELQRTGSTAPAGSQGWVTP